MRRLLPIAAVALLVASVETGTNARQQPPGAPVDRTVGADTCTAATVGTSIPTASIGEPVSSVALEAPRWVAATSSDPAYCSVDGVMAPIGPAPTARPINFRIVLPASWSRRAAHLGGGGMNGVIPNLTGGQDRLLARGFATYGSDSGHQIGRSGGPGAAGPGSEWTTNDEAIKNLGYLQLKKTHDAAMTILERVYGERPRFSYFFGTSQGGREALTVAQRYPADYDGIAANVPIVGFSSLMLAPELIRIQEKPLANWVTRAKVSAIRAEFMRQCDRLDGLIDGVINNYMACRAVFDITQGASNRHPWAAKRCPDNIDPNPADTTDKACLTDGQIATLQLVYSHYPFATPLANGVKSFGMWVPNTDPSGSGLIADVRFKGQEGADENAATHAHLGVLGVTGFLMQNPAANPLDYVEGGPLNRRREQISAWLDSTNPDLVPFAQRGGKLIVAIGTNDTLASPGAQLDFYQSVVDRMGQPAVDRFARLFVIPQTNHGLMGRNAEVDGDGRTIPVAPIPSTFDRIGLVLDWVEKKTAPGPSVIVAAGDRSLPLCTYPTYPKYAGGAPTTATSYACSKN
jgi:hypothetical protein